MPPSLPNAAIRTSNLAKKYGAQVAVAGIDLVIPAGQLVGLLGPNGAGKEHDDQDAHGHGPSDLGQGRSRRARRPPRAARSQEDRRLRPRDGAVFEALTGWEYLNLVASLYHIPESESGERIERFRAFFDLTTTDLRTKKLGAYSKGMRQKVVITAALLHNPQIVFFDEPLNGLDANAALMLKTLITSLAKDGKTIVYCSHVLDVVERMVERVVIVHQGRILEDGTVAQILERSGERTLEQAFNKLTSTQNLLQKAEDFARVLSK
jgi:ABC-2 type transport system ATP-binding protein